MEVTQENEIDVVRIQLKKDRQLQWDRPIQSPEDAVQVLCNELEDWDRECLAVINMTTKGVPLNISIGSIGTINSTLVRPAELFKTSILSNAFSILLVHNHPSGDPSPSRADILMTKRFQESCQLLGFSFLDHVIVGSTGERYSMKTAGLILDENVKMTVSEEKELEEYIQKDSEEEIAIRTMPSKGRGER